eukprot:s133_g12.t1
MDPMDAMDGVWDLNSLVLATETIEPYVLAWQLDPTSDEVAECTVLAVMKREAGMLLAVPTGFLPDAVLAEGEQSTEETIFGPHFVATVASVIEDGGLVSPTGAYIDVVIVDCSAEVMDHLRQFGEEEERVFGYDEESLFAFPSIDALLPQIQSWARQPPGDRVGFYTPQEDEEEEPAEQTPPPTRTRKPALRGATPSGGGAKAKAKRHTTASLAQDMKTLLETMPKISAELGRIEERQLAMEARIPSWTTTRSSPGLLASPGVSKPAELEALEDEKLGAERTSSQTAGDSLARAVMAQSQALTTLVNQIASAHSDPMAELTGRRSVSQSPLQMELASHKGTFFQSVMQQSMSRRMAPTSSPNASAEELLTRGVSGVRYLEQFGGYGRCRELGQLQFQVMSIFDYMMAGNTLAAMDGLALLAVTLEQASIDGGRMDLATLLCLQEDPSSQPPTQPDISGSSFRPIGGPPVDHMCSGVSQRAGVINTKRAEIAGVAKASSDASSSSAPANATAKPKAKWGKKKGKGKGETQQEEERPSRGQNRAKIQRVFCSGAGVKSIDRED